MLRLLPHPPVSELSNRQRVRALKRTLSPRLVKRTIQKVRPRARACPIVPDELAVWLVIGLGLFCSDALRQVWRWLEAYSGRQATPARNTLCMARRRLGARVLIELAKEVLRPLAGPTTPGAFYKGMALRGLDCCHLSLYDSPANRAAFSPPRKPRRPSPLRQHTLWRGGAEVCDPVRGNESPLSPSKIKI